MPNHLNGIVATTEESHNAQRPLGRMIAAFKALTTKRIKRMNGIHAGVIWQRNFYEHIIRNGRSLERILTYIQDNPVRWSKDPENLRARKRSPGSP
jgi:putative transposase